MTRLLLGLVLLVSLGCAPEGSSSSTAEASLLERVSGSAKRTAFDGRRRIQIHYNVLGQQRELDYVERVYSDGTGRFGMQVVDVHAPAMQGGDRDLFALLQRNRQGFYYNHRDFAIRNLNLFENGYTIRDHGRVVVAGHTCEKLQVRRRIQPESVYYVAVETGSGLVLSTEERTLDGQLVSETAFESIELGSVPQDVEWYEPPFDRTPVDMTGSTVETLGFEALRPTLLPAGYRLLESDSLVFEGRTWVRQIFGDGVEQIFFLNSPEQASASHLDPSSGVLDADRVTTAPVGPWVLIEGVVAGQGVIVMGKAEEPVLLNMLQSALETR